MKGVIVDFRISPKSKEALKKLGYRIIKTFSHPSLQKPVCGHPDMLICKISDNVFFAETTICGFLSKEFPDRQFFDGITKLKPEYPHDIAFNCARVGNFLFCNEKYTDKRIIEYCNNNSIKIADTKQGYAKCSICKVSERAIITSDLNIFKTAEKIGIDVLLTKNNGILLEGYDEGFIGGATGLIENDILAINGNIELCGDCSRIVDFCAKYRVKIISLSDEPLTDIGTIIRI